MIYQLLDNYVEIFTSTEVMEYRICTYIEYDEGFRRKLRFLDLFKGTVIQKISENLPIW